jgi:hypothetical protein
MLQRLLVALHGRKLDEDWSEGGISDGRPHHRAQAIVLGAALILAPLGAQGADLVVWWQTDFHSQEDEAVGEIIAAFEQETGKQVELV